MTGRHTPPCTGGTPDPVGVVSGALLRAIRTTLGLSQEQTAEAFRVDVNTVKGWETGRRPLARVRAQTLREITRTLTRLGADPDLLDQLGDAIDVDIVLGEMLAGGHTPHGHPLATWVHTRVWHDLLAWALSDTVPAPLRGRLHVPRPRLAVPDRARLFDQLRTIAEQSGDDDGPAGTLLRRQVYFVASWDDSPAGRDWLSAMERQEVRRVRRHDGWTPTWVAARSLAVARARQGDPDQLRAFIRDHLADDAQEAANLNYWSYWAGEETRPAVSDEFMAGGLGGWRGSTLLRHLVEGLHPPTAYVELTVHTLWALLHRRPWLLDDDPATANLLRAHARTLLDTPDLPASARRELEQVLYAANPRRRP